ncbi:MAG: class I poly(R)-hydroxyalkanoic acid synthase [Rhodobacteraceae bacterium]|nr:class I poly(R)-hydroxyalkanoic acid synthase [Paracoccaceae bacterium]
MTDTPKDIEDLAEKSVATAQNFARISELSVQIWQAALAGQDKSASPGRAIEEINKTLWDTPEALMRASTDFWLGQQGLWLETMRRWTGDTPPPPDLRGGKRFAHKGWSENALFDYIKQAYLFTSEWMHKEVAEADGLSDSERRKLDFYIRSYVDAIHPANFFALNPEVLEATAEQNGENLVRGLKMLLEDIERGKGQLLIRQTDMEAFEVGRDMAITPGKVIWQNNVLQLIQYAPDTDKTYTRPLLFVPPWINKYYILDLNHKKSLMKYLVGQGYSVFIISWVNPTEAQRDETWDSYSAAVLEAVDAVLEATGEKSLNIGGYCVGGTLLGPLLAYLGKAGDKRVASATLFTTQLEFTDAGELQIFADEETLGELEAKMPDGYLPAQTMASAFNMLRANDLIWSYVVNNYLLGKEPFPFDLLYWNADSTGMPARLHLYYLRRFYMENAFSEGDFELFNEAVSPLDVAVPIYHVATKEDHIAPATSVYRGALMMKNATTRFVLAGSGHIAGVINPPAAGKYQYWAGELAPHATLEAWLGEAKEQPGSWWNDWDGWLQKHSGKLCAARAPKDGLEDAPGSYVLDRFDLR